MLADRKTLFDLLIDGCPVVGRGIEGHLIALEPFFRKAEAAEYDLAPADQVDPGSVSEAIAIATGVGIGTVSFVSLSHGASPLVGEARAAFWEAHSRGLTCDLKGALWRRHGVILGSALAEDRKARLERTLWQTLGEPLWHSFERNRWDETGNNLRLVLRANVLGGILDYAGFLMLGSERRIEALRPLLALMDRTLPLGERADRPGTWTCITA